jgi:ABC-type anion transport system duplicated permease subunit
MSPAVRKLNLTAHLLSSIGWFGALLVFLAHAVASLLSNDLQVVRSVCIAMALTAWFVILPLSLASFLTGVVQALGTAWGLVRHYWVVAKLGLTAFATAILLMKSHPLAIWPWRPSKCLSHRQACLT